MNIKEICLEGFKSYATRTVVPGFDPTSMPSPALMVPASPTFLTPSALCWALPICGRFWLPISRSWSISKAKLGLLRPPCRWCSIILIGVGVRSAIRIVQKLRLHGRHRDFCGA
ncbi:hypothetical protein AAG906_012803 [Vitis piasezkii]